MMFENTTIWWVRRDLRLDDNIAFWESLSQGHQVIPLFIADPALTTSSKASRERLAFLWASLKTLDQDLKSRGSRLIFRSGKPQEVLSAFVESGVSRIVAETDHTPYSHKRDRQIKQVLPLELVGGPTIHQPGEVIKKDGSPYTIYTPFMRTWKEILLPGWKDLKRAPDHIQTPANLITERIPDIPYQHANVFLPDQKEAHKRLSAFTSGDSPIYTYHTQRDRLDADDTSHLSPYLRFGMISPRQAVLRAMDSLSAASDSEARRGAEVWVNQLIWREFYISILYHFPTVLNTSFRPQLQYIPWRNNEKEFQSWQQGCTGISVVDAAMRELLSCGWMHNRARMITASFLIKNLLIDWQWGEKWFMQHLLDGDPASNNGGWQWTAGTGTDAAPYFRVFNPVLQGKKFDPSGTYVRRWVSELQNVPDRYIHTPWEMPLDMQNDTGVKIGKTYPHPIVDLSTSRKRAIEAYALAKDIYKQQNNTS